MNAKEAIAALDAIDVMNEYWNKPDREKAHVEADQILLQFVPKKVRKAWERVEERVGEDGFWYA